MPNMTVRDALSVAVDKWGGRNFIYTRVKDEFVPKTFRETANDAKALAEALLDLGLGGKHILIYGENSYEWCLADLAVMGYVGVTVAASADWKENDLENVVNIADSECVIYAESGRTTIESMKAKKPEIKYISMQDDFPVLLERGREIAKRKQAADKPTADKQASRDASQMCKIVFTSGTTSASKAVMLSSENLFFGFESLYRRAPMG
ncbi:MAG: long-chain fatty acid--CoA ligase, partial [Peptococcaceae bacterium]|nr:long-chain fatty acid--CoA ligase [Peptococcaceae bacterium]